MVDTPFDNTLVPVNNSSYATKPLREVTCFKCGEKGHYANNVSLLFVVVHVFVMSIVAISWVFQISNYLSVVSYC